MGEKRVGYKNPPVETRWKRGVSGNPRGRRKREPVPLANVILAFFSTPMEYRDQGRLKSAPRQELLFRRAIEEAMRGSVAAAEFILTLRMNAQRLGTAGDDHLVVSDWLPDYPGQTAHEKTENFASSADAEPIKWWAQHPTKK